MKQQQRQMWPSRPLTEDERRIVENNMGLIYFAIKIYPAFYSRLDPGQAMSLASEALCLAVQRFDPLRGKLSTFIVRYILGAWQKELQRKRRPTRSNVDLGSYADPKSNAALNETIWQLDKTALLRAIEKELSTLTARQWEAVQGVLRSDNLEALSRNKGLNGSCMRTHFQAAVAKLRRAMERVPPPETHGEVY